MKPPIDFPDTDENWDISYTVIEGAIREALDDSKVLHGDPAKNTISSDIAGIARNIIERKLFGWDS